VCRQFPFVMIISRQLPFFYCCYSCTTIPEYAYLRLCNLLIHAIVHVVPLGRPSRHNWSNHACTDVA